MRRTASTALTSGGSTPTCLPSSLVVASNQEKLDALAERLRAETARSVLLAASPLLDGVTGRYFEACNEAELTTDPDAVEGVRRHALDPDDAARLWEVSTAILRS